MQNYNFLFNFVSKSNYFLIKLWQKVHFYKISKPLQ